MTSRCPSDSSTISKPCWPARRMIQPDGQIIRRDQNEKRGCDDVNGYERCGKDIIGVLEKVKVENK